MPLYSDPTLRLRHSPSFNQSKIEKSVKINPKQCMHRLEFKEINEHSKTIKWMENATTLHVGSQSQSKTHDDGWQNNEFHNQIKVSKSMREIKSSDAWERPRGKQSSVPKRCRRVRLWQRQWGAGLGRRCRTSDVHLRMSATTFSLFLALDDDDDHDGGGGGSPSAADGFGFALSCFSPFGFK